MISDGSDKEESDVSFEKESGLTFKLWCYLKNNLPTKYDEIYHTRHSCTAFS